jgi:type I restriction enzyme R subunit
MNNLKEVNFEKYITNYLVTQNDFVLRGCNESGIPVKDKDFDRTMALDLGLMQQFIENSQPKEWNQLVDLYGTEAIRLFAKRVDLEIQKIGVLQVLRDGVTDRGVHVEFKFNKPNSTLNTAHHELYLKNVFSVQRQVYFSPKDQRSVDLVLFLNGLPIITMELKNQLTGQNYSHAVRQYKTDRSSTDKLFSFKRCLVHFAVDNNEAYMTTKIAGLKTYFLPFNQGNDDGKGNPASEGKFATHYLWEDVFKTDSLLDLITNFMHVQVEKKKDPKTGKTTKIETLLFPRYHQRDVVRKLIADAKVNGAGKNYLIQHSAGSGKSNSIAWAAHNLASLHDDNDQKIFDKVIVIVDRRILDKQLRQTVTQFEKQRDEVIGASKGSDLKAALQSKSKIIVSTIQKFPVIVDSMEELYGTKFAVIADEAHSSQSGEHTKALKQTLSRLEDAEEQDLANSEEEDPEIKFALQAQKARGKLNHVSFFAFTATPKEKTLELFGQQGEDGRFTPFSLYSMKQAVEEGFILDVLKNYTTHRMFFELAKKAAEHDPEFEKTKAYRMAVNYADLHEDGISKKAEMMVEHFRSQIKPMIDGKAKAMIVTKSRLHAVRYYKAIKEYLTLKGYPERALVAFSGEINGETEGMLNGVTEAQTADTFDEQYEFKFLVVANKYQTGFDQPKLAAMYVDKILGGVGAVQTLSRLNRQMGSKKSDVFVLDFANDAELIQQAFQPYYTSTILSESTDPNILYDLKRDMLNLGVFTMDDVAQHYSLLIEANENNQAVVAGLLDRVVEIFCTLEEDDQDAMRGWVDDFVRRYSFVAQLFTFGDAALEQVYEFTRNLRKKLPVSKDEMPDGLLDEIDLSSLAISKGVKHTIGLDSGESELDPMVGSGGGTKAPDEMERLSLIIKDINTEYGLPDGMEVDGMELVKRVKDRSDVQKAIANNPKGAAKTHFSHVFEEELRDMFSERADFYKTLDEDVTLKESLAEKVFEELFRNWKRSA